MATATPSRPRAVLTEIPAPLRLHFEEDYQTSKRRDRASRSDVATGYAAAVRRLVLEPELLQAVRRDMGLHV